MPYSNFLSKPIKTMLYAAMFSTPLILAGCGSSSDSNEGGSTSTVMSKGMITGFGSVYVNGVKFETTSAEFDIDDESGEESELRLGMIVSVLAKLNGNGNSGNAIKNKI